MSTPTLVPRTAPAPASPGEAAARRGEDVEHRPLPRYAAGALAVPFVIQGSTETMARDTFWPDHSHPTHELLWNDHGVTSTIVGSRSWTVTSSIGLWIPAGTLHSGWMPAGTRYRAAQLSIEHTLPLASGPVAVDVTPLLRLLLDRLGSADLDAAARARTEAMILDVLAPAPHELLLRIPTSPLLAPVVEQVLTRPDDVPTLSGWASRLGVSTRTVTRTFVAETGLGFSQWVAAARAQQAIALLAQGEPMEEVALRVGYRSVSSFGTAFRRVTGMSPGRFRAA